MESERERERAIATGSVTAGAKVGRESAHRRVDRLELRWTDASGAPCSATVRQRTTLGSSPALADPERTKVASSGSLRVTGRTVSRIHAEIDPRDDGWWIRDLGSRNGTWIDGTLIGEARLRDGLRVALGETVVTAGGVDAASEMSLWPEESFGPLLGRSAAMRELFQILARAAATEYPVLIEAETGTGKELVARAIHDASPWKDGPFVVVDCAGLAESLAERELFGHARGAYTGAVGDAAGAFESAQGGTLFLDEIGELPPTLQPKLLRALESQTVRRLGEVGYRKIETRFVAATHRNLSMMVNQERFREDLYFRLAVVQLRIPPLRERPDDVPLLVDHFTPRDKPRFDASFVADLAKRDWPGNVRQLRNFVQRAVVFGPDGVEAMRAPNAAKPTPPSVNIDVPLIAARDQAVAQFERAYLEACIARHGRDVATIAKVANVGTSYLRKLLKQYGL